MPDRNAGVALAVTNRDEFLKQYRVPPHIYDEWMGPQGEIRTPWEPIYNYFLEVGRAGLDESARLVHRLVRDSSMAQTTSVSLPGIPPTSRRPWQLDPIPWVFSAEEWENLSQGLRQRARLLNRITADLYGERRLLHEGHLPANLLFQHPAYQPAFHQLPASNGLHLHCYTADLAKGADGRWYVVADRTDAPLGVGYTLENRLVLSRAFQSIFRDNEIERLAPFFIQLRALLQSLALTHQDNPRTVLLTQGPGTAGYFEDVYLARYLGYMLVESGDLTVRDDRLMLKTLGGLLQVDVVFRRMTDQWCDPLELQSEAGQGVPGLIRAIRAGNVAIANGLGSSLVESGAFLPYLESLSMHLLGQPLLIPSLRSYWGGTPSGLESIRSDTRLLLRTAFRCGRNRVAPPITAIELGGDPNLKLMETPWNFIGQERIQRSMVPTWRDGVLKPMHAALRVYLVACGDDYMVLPGGLARVSTDNEVLEQDVLAGQNSKEVWVRSEGPVSQVTLLRSSTLPKQELKRAANELPSRVADNLLWLGRYVERVDCSARLLRTALQRAARESEPSNLPEWPGIVRQLADRGLIEPGYAVDGLRELLPPLAERLPSLIFDNNHPENLRDGLKQVIRVASMLRDRLSPDSWHVLHFLDHRILADQYSMMREPDDAIGMLSQLIRDLSAFLGMIAESMTRTLAWRSLDLGRRLERGLGSATIVHQLCGTGAKEPAEWEAMVEASDSLMTYRFRYLASWSLDAVLDLLLMDESNPRSVAYQLVSIVEHVQQMASVSQHSGASPEKQLATKMLQQLRQLDPNALADASDLGEKSLVYAISEDLMKGLSKLFELFNSRYVVHAGPTRNRGK